MKNHPDITGLNSDTMDKDEMEMMDDIGMSGESGDEISDSKPASKIKGKSAAKAKTSKKLDGGDLESLDKEMDSDEKNLIDGILKEQKWIK